MHPKRFSVTYFLILKLTFHFCRRNFDAKFMRCHLPFFLKSGWAQFSETSQNSIRYAFDLDNFICYQLFISRSSFKTKKSSEDERSGKSSKCCIYETWNSQIELRRFWILNETRIGLCWKIGNVVLFWVCNVALLSVYKFKPLLLPWHIFSKSKLIPFD